MTIFATKLALGARRNAQRVSRNDVFFCYVTSLASKILTINAHMDINRFFWVGHRGIKVTVLNSVTTTASVRMPTNRR